MRVVVIVPPVNTDVSPPGVSPAGILEAMAGVNRHAAVVVPPPEVE